MISGECLTCVLSLHRIIFKFSRIWFSYKILYGFRSTKIVSMSIYSLINKDINKMCGLVLPVNESSSLAWHLVNH